MKKYLSVIIIASAMFNASNNKILAQSDKNIIATSEEKLREGDCEAAFDLITTAKKTKGDKAQAIIKKAYPCVISDNIKRVNKINLTDTSNPALLCENLKKAINIIKENRRADSLFKLNVPENTFKAYNKEKKNTKLLSEYKTRLSAEENKIIEAQKRKEQMLMVDSSQTAMTPPVDANTIENTDTMPQQTALNNTPVTKQETTAEVVTEKKIKDIPVSTGKKYYIIQGSYKTTEEAQSVVNKLNADGYSAEIPGQNAFGSYRVSYNSYYNKADAMKELEVIRQVQKDAWILEQ